MSHSFAAPNPFVADSEPESRADFIRKTYLHLAGAVMAFIGLESILLQLPIIHRFTEFALSSNLVWLGILGAFMIVTWMARSLAAQSDSKGVQYAGLGLYVVAEAIIFAPLIILAQAVAGGGVIMTAALMTLLLFGGLTAVVFFTGKDFSFLKTTLTVGAFISLGLIVTGAFFGYGLGTWFSVGMIAFASGAILYDTSKVLHEYREDQYVGASLELFASIALLFWYVLRLLMALYSKS